MARLAAPPIPFDPPLDGDERGQRRARPRAGAHPGRGPRARRSRSTSCFCRSRVEPIEPERGLATLPPPDPGDLFLDLEGDPYALDDGRRLPLRRARRRLTRFTADLVVRPATSRREVTLAGEKARIRAAHRPASSSGSSATRACMSTTTRSYEPTALKRLMGRHATREEEVDRLLRGGVLVDLFRAVRQGLRASVESYSIKRIEPLYDFERADRAPRRRLEHRRLRGMAPARRRRPARLRHPRRDRGLQPGRRREHASASATGSRTRGELAAQTGQRCPAAGGPLAGDATESSWRAGRRASRGGRRAAHCRRARRTAASDRRGARARGCSPSSSPGIGARTKVDLLGVLPPHRARRRRAHRRQGSARAARARRTGRRAVSSRHAREARAPGAGATGSRRRTTTSARGRSSTTRQLPAPHPDARWRTWKLSAELRSIDEADVASSTSTWPAGRRAASSRAARPARTSSATGEHRAALLRLGEWVVGERHRCGRRRGAPRATFSSASARAAGRPVGEPLRAPGETELDAARRLVAGARPTSTLAIQGPPGLGKDVHRRADDRRLLAARESASGSPPSATRSSATSSARCSRRARAGSSRSGRSRRSTEDERTSIDPRVDVVTDSNDEVQAGLRPERLNLVAGTSWLWAPDRSDGARRCPLRRRGRARCRSPTCLPWRGAAALDRPARRSPAARPAAPGLASAGRRSLRPGAPSRRPRRDARRTSGSSSTHTWRLHPDIDRVHVGSLLRGQPRIAPGPRASASHRPRADRRTRCPASRVGARGRRQRVAGRGPPGRRARARARGERVDVDRPRRRGAPDRATKTSWSSRRTTLRSAQIAAPPAAGGPGRHRRQVPGPGGADQHLLDDSRARPEDAPRGMGFLYSRNRLNVATSRARCVAVVVASPRSCACVPERRSRCGSRTRCASSPSWRRAGPDRQRSAVGALHRPGEQNVLLVEDADVLAVPVTEGRPRWA